MLAALWLIGIYSLLRVSARDGGILPGVVAALVFLILSGGALNPAGATSTTSNATSVLQSTVTIEEPSTFEAMAAAAFFVLSCVMVTLRYFAELRDAVEGADE